MAQYSFILIVSIITFRLQGQKFVISNGESLINTKFDIFKSINKLNNQIQCDFIPYEEIEMP